MQTFTSMTAMGTLVAVLFIASPAPAFAAPSGQQIYAKNCAACHQSRGQGLAGDAPPLAHNPRVTGNLRPLIETMLNGGTGAFSIDGKSYTGVMPAWRRQLSKDQIAAVTTYIRLSWGNHASAVVTAQVK
jgi:mono/diheme cytochrome c family protein